MPTYDYTCQDCKAPFEVRMSITAYSEGAKTKCDKCGSENVVRAFTAVNVLTSGRGSSGASSGPVCGPGKFT
jgi:putative FmdB family regulatory protein